MYVQHATAQLHHLQGAQNASFNNQLPMTSYYLPGSLDSSSSAVDVD
jgi:hypothetical protein